MSTIIFTQSDLQRFERLMSQYKLNIKSKLQQYKKYTTGVSWDSLQPYCNYYNNTLSLGLKSSMPIVVNTWETGRSPGKVPYDFERTIFKWSMSKGIQFKNQKERWAFSNAVKWKTIKAGSKQFRDGRNEDIFTNQYSNYDKQIASVMSKCFADGFYRLKLNFL